VFNRSQEDAEREQREAQKPKFVVEAEIRLEEYASGKRAGGGQQLADAAIVAGYNLYKTGIQFREWVQGVVAKVGEEVRPFLRSTWRLLQSEEQGRQSRYTIADIPVADNLDPRSRNVETRFREYLANNFDAAVIRYQLEYGKEINTDNVRELSKDYSASNQSRGRLLYVIGEPARWFRDELYKQKLSEPPKPGEEPIVIFTAGGTGAGKSTSLQTSRLYGDLFNKSQIIYDSTLTHTAGSIYRINLALDAGKKVYISAVYREPVDAYRNGVLPRAMGPDGKGRTPSIDEHIEFHSKIRDSLETIIKFYKDDPRVGFSFIDNTRGMGNAVLNQTIDIFKPIEDYELLRDRLVKETEEAYANGEINTDVYNAALERIGDHSEANRRTGKEQDFTRGAGRNSEQEAERKRGIWETGGGTPQQESARVQVEEHQVIPTKEQLRELLEEPQLQTSNKPGSLTNQKPKFVIDAEVRLKESLSGYSVSSETRQFDGAGEKVSERIAGIEIAENAKLINSLRTISTIDSIDPEGARYSWKDLALKSAGIAREALTDHEAKTVPLVAFSEGGLPVSENLSQDNSLVEALRKIADLESMDASRYSWKERTLLAMGFAREALDSTRELSVERSSSLQQEGNISQSQLDRGDRAQERLVRHGSDEDPSFSF
jgi:hypothetical protein